MVEGTGDTYRNVLDIAEERSAPLFRKEERFLLDIGDLFGIYLIGVVTPVGDTPGPVCKSSTSGKG